MTDWALRTVPAELTERYVANGWWTDDTFGTYVRDIVARDPELQVRIWSHQRPYDGTVGELWAEADRLAGGLRDLGVEPGDVVAYQVPNWAETIVTLWAGFRLGVVLVPIIHFYGKREVDFILRQSGARVLVTVDRFGHVDHLANLAEIRDDLPGLEHVVVISDTEVGDRFAGGHDYVDLIRAEPYGDVQLADPGSPAMVGYTSGTTSSPKGVVHTHRSLLFEVRQLSALNLNTDRPTLMSSPLAHMTGMLGGSLMPMHRGVAIHLTDQWNPTEVLDIMIDADVSSGSGATIFLTSLIDAPGFGPQHLEKMPSVGLGGSPVPAAVAERAEALGIKVTRAYGSTEHPSITGAEVDEPAPKRNRTDGHVLEGVEMRLVDDEGRAVPVGEPGEILSRGPDLFAGYTDPALTAAAIDADGWYHTGDVGVLDDEGYLTITDRTSDIIIRGGTNISAAEIEELLVAMDDVTEVAVVAAPDQRLGEHACAWLRMRDDADAPDLAAVQAYLASHELPKQKWVEDVRIVDGDFPRTPSGKIKKFELRRILREE